MAPEEKRRGGKQRLVHGKSPASKLPSENHETQDCPGLLPPSLALSRHPVRLSPATTGPLLCCSCRVECFSLTRTLPQLSDFSERPLDPHPPQVAPGAPQPLPRLSASMLTPHQPAGSLSVQLWEHPSVRQTGAGGPSTVLGGAGGTVSSVLLRVVLSCNGRSGQAVAGSWWRGQAAPQRGSRARSGFLGSRGRGRQSRAAAATGRKADKWVWSRAACGLSAERLRALFTFSGGSSISCHLWGSVPSLTPSTRNRCPHPHCHPQPLCGCTCSHVLPATHTQTDRLTHTG